LEDDLLQARRSLTRAQRAINQSRTQRLRNERDARDAREQQEWLNEDQARDGFDAVQAEGNNRRAHTVHGNTESGPAPLRQPAELEKEKESEPSPPSTSRPRREYSGSGPKSGCRRGGRQGPKRTCFTCGSSDHIAKACPLADGRTPEDKGLKTAERVQRVVDDDFLTKVAAVQLKYTEEEPTVDLCAAMVRAGFYAAIMRSDMPFRQVCEAIQIHPQKEEVPVAKKTPGVFEGPLVDVAKYNERQAMSRTYLECGLVMFAFVTIMLMTFDVVYRFGYIDIPCVLARPCSTVLSLVTGLVSALIIPPLFLRYLFGGKQLSTQTDVQTMGPDKRLATMFHVDKHDNGVRVHRYRLEKWQLLLGFIPWKRDDIDLYVVDHWLAIALSEHGFGSDNDIFLKNVHLKFLRAAILGISDLWYTRLKEDTTTFLEMYLRGDFPRAVPASWLPGGVH